MSTFFIYMAVVAIVIALVVSKRFRVFFVAVALCACFIYGAFAARNALAEEAGETRTCWIIGFDLANSVFVVEDEDGFLWDFYLEEDDYSLGDEYILHLPANAEPYCEAV